jgi:protein phosphatase
MAGSRDDTQAVSIFKFYSETISVQTAAYEAGRHTFVLPVVPFPVLRDILERSRAIFEDEPMLLSINCDVLVVGDLHGHILDLFRIFHEFGFPPNTRYLFLGDLVDRGEFSTETTVLILTLKVLWPSAVWLIRGNHEFCDMWLSGGFIK